MLYNLERLSVLVVDDSSFACTLMVNVLRAMGVGTVITASDGAEAIELLKAIAEDPMRVGIMSLDLIISDWIMSPVDGLMLLRWVRRHKESPDRYMPFIMVSGLADMEKVNEARDWGATEFIIKPFSIQNVADKILAVIDAPRKFVYNYEYFGPDRRRQNTPIAGANRRKTTKEEVEIVHSQKKVESLNKKPKVWYFNLPNKLKDKCGGLGQKGEGEATINPELLEIAEQQIVQMEVDYIDWIQKEIQEMLKLFGQLEDDHEEANAKKILKRLHEIAHELRGQGTTFGYPLITVFGQSLYEYTEITHGIDDKLVELLKAHIDGIRAVIREKIKDDTGGIGAELIKSLEQAREKFKKDRKSK